MALSVKVVNSAVNTLKLFDAARDAAGKVSRLNRHCLRPIFKVIVLLQDAALKLKAQSRACIAI